LFDSATIKPGKALDMFTLPSVWNLVISTFVFIIAVWYIRRYLEEQGIPKGMARGLLVFILAYIVSWGAGVTVDWIQEKIEGPQPTAQTSDDLSRLMKEVEQAQH
jgi:predicted PurR-regulated permease PerM